MFEISDFAEKSVADRPPGPDARIDARHFETKQAGGLKKE